jgi:hypothetical protein
MVGHGVMVHGELAISAINRGRFHGLVVHDERAVVAINRGRFHGLVLSVIVVD